MKTAFREELNVLADEQFKYLVGELEKHCDDCQCAYCDLIRSLLSNYLSQ
jgi:hypothetical protein